MCGCALLLERARAFQPPPGLLSGPWIAIRVGCPAERAAGRQGAGETASFRRRAQLKERGNKLVPNPKLLAKERLLTATQFGTAYTEGFDHTTHFLAAKGLPETEAREIAQAAWTRGFERRHQLRDSAMVLTWVNMRLKTAYFRLQPTRCPPRPIRCPQARMNNGVTRAIWWLAEARPKWKSRINSGSPPSWCDGFVLGRPRPGLSRSA